VLSRLSPGARAALAALGVVIGVALIFVGLGAFQPERSDPPAIVVPEPGASGSIPAATDPSGTGAR
jgi:hypothetical protein